jgi:hypothetical protein
VCPATASVLADFYNTIPQLLWLIWTTQWLTSSGLF